MLREYKKKRNFRTSPEPQGKAAAAGHIYCIQKHDASHLHYDLRLQVDGALKSWAIPKGPSLDPGKKRLAIEVEDHPVDYATFEGTIPKGYGAGEVIVWDYGTWEPTGNARKGLKKGRLEFNLHGKKLHGRWTLIRLPHQGKKSQWLLMKQRDSDAKSESDYIITDKQKQSVLSRRRLERDADFLEPQLAKLAKLPPQGSQWIHEVKFDGYRTLCHLENGKARLFTRNGLDWSKKYPSIRAEAERLGIKNGWIDGEIVCLDQKGRSDFQLLQENLKSHRLPLTYYVFDLLALDGRDLRTEPLLKRKSIVKREIRSSDAPHIRYSEHWKQSGTDVLRESCRLGLEGIVSKEKDAPYISGRSGAWIKTKCGKGQEFIIVGYTPPQSGRVGFGALLIAAHDKSGKLAYAGRVGTGFNRQVVADLMRRFKQIERKQSPLEQSVPESSRVHWVKPTLVADIHFAAWTRDKILRQASFHGLRLDKPAIDVDYDQVAATKPTPIALSHPDKILIEGLDITKREIWKYYESVQKWMLPYVSNRPLALVRCPNGIGKGCFFQKNIDRSQLKEIRQASAENPKGETIHVIYIDSASGILRLVQMGVLEIHAWGALVHDIPHPDQLIFDLDPGETVTWSRVVDGALHLKAILDRLKLRSFVKFTGGKGLHVQVPIVPRYGWNEIKAFTKAIAHHMSEEQPESYVFNLAKSKRKGRIFIDYLRNGYGATAVVPYSLRANSHAGIALPVAWKHIHDLEPAEVTIRNILAIIKKRKSDPWKNYFVQKRPLPLSSIR